MPFDSPLSETLLNIARAAKSMFVVVEVEDGFLVGEPSRRLNLESLCDPAGSLDRFTRASTYPYDDLSTCTRVLLGMYLSPPKKRGDNVILRVNASGRVDESRYLSTQ